ncbi:serine protease [Geotalea uraniireducens]|uniref:Serine protease n=1 Tax=Geotalea uraniireducens TaxID=351604 RepID=A0ABM8EHB2_9BACT|nr:CAP domain-containing protein [Geotalea uraniireducens]BDV41827.1 serine protease [Geotalea uraniireducens]
MHRLIIALTLCCLMLPALPARAATPLDRAVVAELNLARTAPRRYVAFLRDYRRHLSGKMYLPPGGSVRIVTREGAAAVDEAIGALLRQRPIPPLAWSDGLAAVAAELAGQQEQTGATGHGAGDEELRNRVERQGSWQRSIGENISYGPDDARQIVLQLIIDDGVKGRGHRRNIFDPAYRQAGVACAPHPVFGTGCVIDFAGGFTASPAGQ